MSDLRNVTISEGTTNPHELIVTFTNFIKTQIPPETFDEFQKQNPLMFNASLTDEDASWVLSDLFDMMDEFAPDDFYFGSHPGDGALYGYWQLAF